MSSQAEFYSPQRQLYLLSVVLFAAYLCIAIPLTILPVYVIHTLKLDNFYAGLSVGAAFISTIFTRAYVGRFADEKGAKRAVVWGLFVFILAALLILLSYSLSHAPMLSYGVLLIARLLGGLGESLCGVAIVAWGLSIVGPNQSGKVLSIIGMAGYGAFALGAPVGLMIFNQWGFVQTILICLILPVIALCILTLIKTPELTSESHSSPRESFVSLIRTIWWYGSVICLQGIGFAAIGAFFVLYFKELNWQYAGFGLGGFGAGFVLSRILFGSLPDKFGGMLVAILSLVVETLGLLMIWAADQPLIALLGTFITGLGCSMIFPSMGREVVKVVKPKMRGTAMGGFTAFQDLSYGLTGPLAGILANHYGYGSVFLISSFAAILGLIISVTLLVKQRQAASAIQSKSPL